jgi:hypothetical protein
VIDNKLGDRVGAGDFKVLAGNITGMDTNNWRGHKVNWKYGDVDWDIADFRLLCSPLIASVDRSSQNSYVFRMYSGSYLLDKTVPTTESKIDTAANILDWIRINGGYTSVSFVGTTSQQQSANLSFNVEAGVTTWSDILDVVARSINCSIRISEFGVIELVSNLKTSSGNVSPDDYVDGSIRQVETQPAMDSVLINYNWSGGYDIPNNDNDNTHSDVTATTSADTGELSEQVVINTCLTATVDANQLLADKLYEYDAPRRTYELMLFNRANSYTVGDVFDIDSNLISGNVIITRIRRTPTLRTSLIEVKQ